MPDSTKDRNCRIDRNDLPAKLIRAMPDLVWFKDPGGVYLLCNARFEAFFGAREAEIVGKTDYDFVKKESADFFRQKDEEAIAHGTFVVNEEEVCFVSDGHREVLETIKTPIYDEKGRLLGVMGVGRDITERKTVAETLRYHELLMNEMGRIAKIGGWEFDPATGQSSVTDEVARILDLSPNAETNVEIGLNLFHGENRDRIAKAVKAAAEKGVVYDLELEMISAKGKPKWVHTRGVPKVENGRVVQVYGSLQDITEQKLAREKSRKNSERLRLALQAADMGIWEWDLSKNHIRWSPETLNIFGIGRENFCGTFDAYLGFVSPSMRREVEHKVNRFLEKAEDASTIHFEHEIIRGNNEPGWVEVRATLFLGQKGHPRHVTGVFADVTPRKTAELDLVRFQNRLEDRVRERTAQLEAANEELKSFSYSVSHDLRAPLRAIDGYSRILLEDFAPHLEAEGRRVCNIISKSARDMGRLIDDLLSFSRIGRSAMQPSTVAMARLADSIFHELTTGEERGRIDLEIDDLPNACADPTLTRQIWSNLLANAIKFSSKKPRTRIRIRAEAKGDEVVYQIRDNGAGFDMKYVNKLFGMFQRLHSTKEFEGTGVGLAIVQRIVNRHGGRIWAKGRINSGAEFCFTLPAEIRDGTAVPVQQTSIGGQNHG